MTDWSTIASLATAGGTLVLAVATFASIRSANRSARVPERSARTAERSLLAGQRPLLVNSRLACRDLDPRDAGGHEMRSSASRIFERLHVACQHTGAAMSVRTGAPQIRTYRSRVGMID